MPSALPPLRAACFNSHCLRGRQRIQPIQRQSGEPLAIGIAVLQQRDQRPDRIGRGNRSSVGAIDSELAPSCTARAWALARASLASSSPSSRR
jgi:hypothetical protein